MSKLNNFQFIIIEMADIEIKAQQKIQELLNNIYQTLTKHPLASQQQRQLLPAQEELMANLDKESFLYQSLLRIMAIDSYCTAIVNQVSLQEELSGMITATLQGLNELGEALQKNSQKKKILQKYNKSTQSLVQTIKIVQEMIPTSNYFEDQRALISSARLDFNVEESVLTKLRQQNQELRKKSESNELQITNMENKLTKLLKQHEGCERSQEIGNAMSNIQLRQQLALREAQLERMNEQFSFEIEKYNTVFEAMKHQLQQMKGYQNVDLIEQIELLETEIVRLRQERDRDQIIIRQLRSDNTMFSSAGYYSPRQSNRYQQQSYQNSRFNY